MIQNTTIYINMFYSELEASCVTEQIKVDFGGWIRLALINIPLISELQRNVWFMLKASKRNGLNKLMTLLRRMARNMHKASCQSA